MRCLHYTHLYYGFILCFAADQNMRPTNTISSSWSRRVFDWTSNKKATTKRRLSIGSNRIGNVVKEYARYCTLHGVQYVFKDNSSILERLENYTSILFT